jgi:hypothetical protein
MTEGDAMKKQPKSGRVNGRAGADGAANDPRTPEWLDQQLKGMRPLERVKFLGQLLETTDAVGPVETQLDGLPGTARKALDPPPSPTGSNGDGPRADRDQGTGRFAPGNRCGRGNPHARRQADLRAALAGAVGPDRLRKITARMADMAEAGDLEACKLLFDYLLGKPGPAPDPDRLDLEEWKLLDAQPTTAELARALIDNVDAGAAAEVLRGLLPADAAGTRQRMREGDVEEVMCLRDRRTGRRRKPSCAVPR